MVSADELVSFMTRQVEVEDEIVSSLNRSLEGIRNQAVRSALKGISLNSVKHADMYRSAITLLTHRTPALDEEQLDMQTDLVKRHIEMEELLIERLRKMLPKVENEKVSLLLKAIMADERRHHELLKRVLRVLVRGETITEDDWWDLVWRDVEELYL